MQMTEAAGHSEMSVHFTGPQNIMFQKTLNVPTLSL